ncbi:hypothetical protein [Nonomuraea soli]|uniref:Uncharacterized protein n=1 Tax=Nonomuraea soli TaxID=1032476 RepID=A0A7W0CJE0_9ACTN|nr:hypothetical protein [Nonomuraea soli]MBA2892302.1 hypothetical protein [Nonomuraea soli]
MNHRALIVSLLALVAVTSCSMHVEQESAPIFVAASSTGAILYEPQTESHLGYASDGRRVWTDRQAAVCAARCPEAAFSTATRKVLSQRGDADTVVAEGATLRIQRADGKKESFPVADVENVLWLESPDRTTALLLYADPTVRGGEILRFRRDADGWRSTGERVPAGGFWGGCVGGDWAILTGERGGMLRDGTVVPLQVSLDQPGECVAGTRGGAVVSRYVDQRGIHHTEVRGIDPSGRQTWSRDVAARAGVIADPSGTVIGLVHDGELELLDVKGQVRERREGVVAARFTETGSLVTVDTDGKVIWAA